MSPVAPSTCLATLTWRLALALIVSTATSSSTSWTGGKAASSPPQPPPVTAKIVSRQTLWKPTKDEKLLRIPALATLNATHVIAFAEVHVNPDNHIVGKSSTDGGASWGREQVIAAEHQAKIGNPAPVVVGDGAVLLVYCRNNLRVLARNITLDDRGTLVMSPAADITANATAGLPPYTFVASGPPGGIRSLGGRIVVAMDFIPKAAEGEDLKATQSSRSRSFAIASDDAGRTWHHSAPIGISGPFSTSENQVASVDDDLATIITTARVGNTTPVSSNFRAVAVSTDQGRSFAAFKETNLPDPTCVPPNSR